MLNLKAVFSKFLGRKKSNDVEKVDTSDTGISKIVGLEYGSKGHGHVTKVRQGEYNIHYREELIPTLEDHHEVLVDHCHSILNAISLEDYEEANRLFSIFQKALWEHLHEENLLFYGFFNFMQSREPHQASERSWEIYGIVKKEKQEMSAIGRAVKKFIYRFEGNLGPVNSGTFKLEFGEVITTLGKRIHKEEQELYPLYREFAEINNLDLLMKAG